MKEEGRRGFVIVYTGDGKGRATAAIGADHYSDEDHHRNGILA